MEKKITYYFGVDGIFGTTLGWLKLHAEFWFGRFENIHSEEPKISENELWMLERQALR
jgi:hypothetical protein